MRVACRVRVPVGTSDFTLNPMLYCSVLRGVVVCRHMLYPVSLTRTPAGARAGSRESEMVVYVAGGRCARRLKMLYAALYFQDRLEAGIPSTRTRTHTYTCFVDCLAS